MEQRVGRFSDADLSSLSVEVSDDVARVTLRGPGKGNAMGFDFWRELPVVFNELDDAPEVRVVIVSGAGECFSVGLDVHEVLPRWGPALDPHAPAEQRAWLHKEILRFQAAITAVATCRKPVVAAVSGWCLGGGLDLVAAADIRLASPSAIFGLRETRLSIVSDVGSLQRLRGIIGEGQLRELAYTGRDFDAAYAHRIGLATLIPGDRRDLAMAADALAGEIVRNPPLSVQGTKQILNEAREHEVAADLRNVALWNAAYLATFDLGEALAAMADRRPGRFEGR